MDPDYTALMHACEDRHWWFVARRRILAGVLDRFAPRTAGAQVLEAGCGTGGNLALLARYGALAAFELDAAARALASARGVVPVAAGRLPDEIPFSGPFALICALDVLEHLKDDLAALRALGSRLAPGGRLLVTVPAYRSLWSHHDVVTHHERRYRRRELVDRIEAAGLHVRYATYFNTILFPVVWTIRALHRATGRAEGSDVRMPAAPANALLTAVFAAERFLVPPARLPFGVSILAVAERAG
ncbi:MAG: class I SAM-dependent methyltransferase [Planctomycetota bacterium]